MIEIYLLIVSCIAFVGLADARRARPAATRRRRPKRNWVNITVQQNVALGALVNAVVVKATLLDVSDDFFLYSSRLSWALVGLPIDEGRVSFGISDNAYTVTEIGEAVDASPTNKSDRIALERTARAVRNIGYFPGNAGEEDFNDGKPVYNRSLFNVSGNSALAIWAMNRSGSDFVTGSTVRVDGVLTGWWT